jgi:hypothetical protein
MKCAIVVKCGWLSAEIAMNSTFSRHSRSIWRLEVIPREYASKMIFRSTAGS